MRIKPYLDYYGEKMVPEGKCPKCGLHYFGWGLNNLKENKCPICGCNIEIQNVDNVSSKDASQRSNNSKPPTDRSD